MDAIQYIKDLMSYLPQNNMEDPPYVPTDDPITRKSAVLNEIIPDNPNAAYDMKKVITETADNGIFFEIKKNFAPNIIVGFARYGGKAIGIVANQPSYYAGVLDIDSSIKGARFVRFCDCFNIPVLTFVDVPGFLPGTTQEFGGVIRNGAKLLYAYAESTVPKVTIITRKSYGGAYCAMSSKHLRTDINYSWPTGEIAVMGSKGAVEVLHAKGAKAAEDPRAFLAEKEAEYNEQFSNPYCAAERGYIDDVIEPRNTRFRVIRALQSLATKKDVNPPKKHSNLPL
jgi:propionyl-CoA carboxylase beta chain